MARAISAQLLLRGVCAIGKEEAFLMTFYLCVDVSGEILKTAIIL